MQRLYFYLFVAIVLDLQRIRGYKIVVGEDGFDHNQFWDKLLFPTFGLIKPWFDFVFIVVCSVQPSYLRMK